MKKRIPLLASILSLLLLPGCVSYRYATPPPKAPQAIPTTVTDEQPSKANEFPIGTYYDEGSHIAFTGHQKGQVAGMMFGLVGVLVVDQANKSSGSSKFGAQAKELNLDLKAKALKALQTEAAKEINPRLNPAQTGELTLKVSPYALFVFNKAQMGRLYAVLRAELVDKKGESLWKGRYFGVAHEIHPYSGDSSWGSHGVYEASMEEALQRAAGALVADFEGHLTGRRKVLVKGEYGWISNEPFEVRALVLAEKDDLLTLRFVVGDPVIFAGTHVIEKGSVSLKDTDFSIPEGL